MRRIILATAALIGLIILIVVIVVGYAYFNLNSIIASNRARLLAKASDAIGRPIEANEIKASLGRGISIEITGVKIEDDPAFSQLPFVQADDVFLKVQFLPLLHKEIDVTELVLRQPQIRIIRGTSGGMNLSTIAKKRHKEEFPGVNLPKSGGGSWFGGGLGASSGGGAPATGGVSIKTFTIEDGRIVYLDQAGGEPVTVNALNLKVANFSLTSPFDIELDLAAFGDHKNLEVSGTAGPIVKDGASTPRVRVPLKITANGSRTDDKIVIQQADLTLANLAAKITDIAIADGRVTARIDTNKFDLAPVAGMIARAQPFNPTGVAEVHTGIAIAGKQPHLDGTLTLANVNVAIPGGKTPPVSDFSGTIRLAGKGAKLGPLTFKLGSGHAQLEANADSLQPMHTTYRLSVDKITVAELVPSRAKAGDENLVQVSAAGTASNDGGAFSASTRLNAASGMLANVPFSLLTLDASYADKRVNVNSLKLGAFDGSIATAGVAALGGSPTFDFRVDTQNVNLQKALDSQHAKAANTIRGSLTANIQIAGEGKGFEQIKP
ncbi:MAG: AsmA family protein, partial [Deltaproteobacteria bacterium]|nr:AsmA family protein [Deltaproteobacteria bacterium]